MRTFWIMGKVPRTGVRSEVGTQANVLLIRVALGWAQDSLSAQRGTSWSPLSVPGPSGSFQSWRLSWALQ